MGVTSSSQGQFTYDFGIAIAQSTVSKITQLAGVTLTLAAAYHALMSFSKEYIGTLKTSALHFNGYLRTIQVMEQAQKRLIDGVSHFSVKDQMSGMRQLMSMGVDVQNNLDFITKAAHASEMEFSQFAGTIAQGIQGSMNGLVEMGLLTQRAARMFERYPANTVMRQQAIMNFVKQHKGLQEAIKNDFLTIEDQMMRLKGVWQTFIKSVMGDPKDRSGLYGQIVTVFENIANGFKNNIEKIRRAGYVLGKFLGYLVQQVGQLTMWVARKIAGTIGEINLLTENYKERVYDIILGLEFWKVKIIRFLKEYKNEIMLVVKLILVMMALNFGKKLLIGIGQALFALTGFRTVLIKTAILLGKVATNPSILFSGFSLWATKMTVAFKGIWGALGGIGKAILLIGKNIIFGLPKLIGYILSFGKVIAGLFTASNPVGWIILAIALFTILWVKVKGFRDLVKSIINFFISLIRVVYNFIAYIFVMLRIGFINVSKWFSKSVIAPIKGFFGAVGSWISKMWDKFKDSSIGKWITKWIVDPITKVFDKIGNVWNFLKGGIGKLTSGVNWVNDALTKDVDARAASYGIKSLTWGTEKGNIPITDKKPITTGAKTNTAFEQNPMLSTPTVPRDTEELAGGTSMAFNAGAIQINLNGSNIDENKLANKIREVILDMQRTTNVRGGNI